MRTDTQGAADNAVCVQAAAAGQLRILWIEDDPRDVELGLRELKKAGFQANADVIHTQGELSERLAAFSYDLVLADYKLPGWTGLEALGFLRAQGQQAPFILVTGKVGEETAIDCVKRGAADCVLKDRLFRLPIAVRRALEEKKLRDEHTRAVEALRVSETRYRLLFERNLAGVFRSALDGQILVCNEACARILGYSSPQELLKHRTPELYFDAAERQEILDRLNEQGAVSNRQIRFRRQDGSPIWVLLNVNLVETDPGAAVVEGTLLDISEQRRAEEALRESEEKYRRIVETAGEGILIIDENHCTTFANREMAGMLGYTVEEMTGRPIFDFMDEESAAIARENLALRSEIVPANMDFKLRARDGHDLWVIVRSTPLADSKGQRTGVLSMFTDITQRRRSQEERAMLLARAEAARAQAKAEQRFRQLMEAAPDAILQIDREGRIVLANKATERVFGYRCDELIGKSIEILIPPRFRERHPGFRTGCLSSPLVRNMHSALDPRARRKDGAEISVEIDISPVETEEGALFTCIIRDVTERKQLEEKLRQSQKMEALGRLAGGVAHDFNNLLTIIGGYGHMVLDGLRPKDPLRKDLEPIMEAAYRAATLTRQLLTFSRRQVVQPKVLDLNRVVARMNKMLRRVIGEDIELNVRLRPGLGRVKADPGQMGQVIMNLAVNARDAMPNGGKLTIETGEVVLGSEWGAPELTPGRYVVLTISDTGTGMDAQVRSRIFEPFFTTKQKGKGTGLGLSTVYGIVKQSGGEIRVDSEPGRGTTFSIYLPLAHETARASGPRPPVRGLERGTETILLVEDEDEVRVLASEMLRRQGYTVLNARGGEEALRIWELNRNSIDMLLTDVIMPQMSGRELAERLRAMRPDLPVLYISGYTGDVIARHGILESDAAFLQKPFTLAELGRKVRAVLNMAQGGSRAGCAGEPK